MGVPGRPGEGGNDSRDLVLLMSACFTVRTEPEVDVIVRDRSGGLGLAGDDIECLLESTEATDSGRGGSGSKNPLPCFSVSGLAVTLLDSG